MDAGELRLAGTLAGLSGTTLTGGIWVVNDAATLRVANADIVTNAADLALLGPDAELVNQTGADALRNLAVNNGGLVLQGKGLALGGDFANNDTLELGPGSELSLTGDFTQAPAGRFEVGVLGPAARHRLRPHRGLGWRGSRRDDLLRAARRLRAGAGDTFTVIDAASLAGTFATIEGDLPVAYDVPAGDVILGTGSTGGCTATWDGGALTTSWHDAANWSPDGLPGPGDIACIPEGAVAVHDTGATTIAGSRATVTWPVNGGSLEITDASARSRHRLPRHRWERSRSPAQAT